MWIAAPLLLTATVALAAAAATPAQTALDAQDRAALEAVAGKSATVAEKRIGDASAQLQAALDHSLLAQLAIELGDKPMGRRAAEAGMKPARRAVELQPNSAEAHRLLGTLCGQVIPASPLSALKYGRCALDEVKRAIELDPKSSNAWLSRGVGNYYLPSAFGGGVDLAIQDLQKAVQLDPKSAEAHLWLGIALRKASRNADARKALTKAISLNPQRKWARQQWEKTPEK